MGRDFHTIIREASGNPFLIRVAEGLYRAGLEYRRVARDSAGISRAMARAGAELVINHFFKVSLAVVQQMVAQGLAAKCRAIARRPRPRCMR